ncbi:MAG TPA: endolytic transglycosylase MltG, partial [Clostridia bacterium]|nr:endolytic transglycosylase MltG [Clostridia bacterium]
MKDEQNIDEERRRKVEGFRVQINDDRLTDDTPDTVISSYSDPVEGEKRRERSKTAAADRAQLAHKLRDEEKARKNKSFFRLMWFSFLLMFSLLAAKYLVTGVNDMLAVGRQPVNVTVEIPKNATTSQVTKILYQAGAIRDEQSFSLFTKLTKAPKTYNGGSYQVTTGMDYEALINSIQSRENR